MKRLVLMLSVTLAAFLAPMSMGAGGTVTYTATYDGTPVLGTETLGGVTYTTVRLPGLYNVGEPGTPSLPVDYIRFSVPYNATNFSVRSVPLISTTLAVDNPLYPCQSSSMTITMPDHIIYNSSNYYPQHSAWIVDESMFAGENHIVTVAYMPFEYLHQFGSLITDSIKQIVTARIDLNYDIDGIPSLNPIIRKQISLRSEGYRLTKKRVVNPDDVERNAPPLLSTDNNDRFTMTQGASDLFPYMIVTTPELRHSMRKIAALRMQKGFNTKVVTIDEAINEPYSCHGDSIEFYNEQYLSFTDDAGKLRQYLRYNYKNNGADYVLLAGSGVPYKTRYGAGADMYFCELTADWMYRFEQNCELHVGRLLGNHSNQFDNYTDKLFRYELNPGNGDYSYLKRALFSDSEIYYCYSGALAIDACPDTTYIPENIENGTPTGSSVIDTINTNHYGYVTFFLPSQPSYAKTCSEGMGNNSVSHYLWAIDTVKIAPNVEDFETGNGLNCLQNKRYPMLFFSQYGNTMPYKTVPGYEVDVNFGESFTMGKDYGGPLYMGLTTSEYIPEMILFNYNSRFRSNIDQGETILSHVQENTKEHFYGYYSEETVCGYNYLGDPLLDMWTDVPQHFSGIAVMRSDSGISVSGIDEVNTKVAYHSNDGNTGCVTVSSNNITLSNVSPNSTIMLYKHNHIPYIAPLLLQNTTLDKSQYVIASDVTAGKSVDNNRINGQVTISGDIDYEIEHTGEVRLCGGFKVNQGARFTVKPSTYNK